ncbi:molecular chaperone [Providencia sp. R33]|nr:molecular chaperone [Providencia sp. R33]
MKLMPFILCKQATLGLSLLALMSLLSLPSVFAAGLRLDQSRIIVQANQPQQAVTIENDSDKLYLIQTNVRDKTPDGEVSSLWLVTPPLFRLASNSQQSVKILPQAGIESLPTDRESLFYFSATALPAIPKPVDGAPSVAQISVATRLVVKLFYRPQTLPMTYEQASSQVTFTQSGHTLCVDNPTPYYLTFSTLHTAERPLPFPAGLMLAPFSRYTLGVSEPIQRIQWRTLNDYGGSTPQFDTQVQRGGNKC